MKAAKPNSKKLLEVSIIEANRDAEISKIWARTGSRICLSIVNSVLLILLILVCVHYNFPPQLSALVSGSFGLSRFIPPPK